MAGAEDHSPDFVSALWAFKQAFENAQGERLNFASLRRDAAYRQHLLEQARLSGRPDLIALADRVRQADSAGNTTVPPGGDEGVVKAGRNHSMGVALLSLLVIVIGGFAGFLVTSGALPGGGGATIPVNAPISGDTVWRNHRTYRLQDVIYVDSGARLTIEAGTRILGEPGSALVVTRGAQLLARGRVDAPIVFTSTRQPGERRRGDWGGVVLLGDAPINRPEAQVEGLDRTGGRASFGGQDPAGTCGVLEYVRIEFAGFELSANNELNGLTLGGCGNATIVRHVQVHMALDDGVEVFGGTPMLRHILITRAGDDGLDWDMGWTGGGQFVIIQQDGDTGDNAIEADNGSDNHDATPRSAPVLYNLTLLGGGNPGTAQRGMTLRRGTAGQLSNLIVTDFPLAAVDVRDATTAEQAAFGTLAIRGAVFYAGEASQAQLFPLERGAQDDDDGFDERAWLSGPAASNRFGGEPPLTAAAPDNQTPSFTPANDAIRGSPVRPPQGEFWDEGAIYAGAIAPGTAKPWTDGWTAFPID